MAGVTRLGQRYQDPSTGRYGTAAEHVAYKKQQKIQLPYTEAEQSPAVAGGGAVKASQTSKATGAGYNVDPYGYTSYNDTGEQGRRTAAAQAQIDAAAEARRIATLKDMMAQYGGMTGGNPSQIKAPPTIQHDASGNEAAARAAAFARAKDASGNLASAQLRGLEGAMAGRGVSGSPIEVLGQAQVLGGARGGLDQVITEQMLQDLSRAGEVSDLEYTGGITQRGQDMSRPRDPKEAFNEQLLLSLFSQLY